MIYNMKGLLQATIIPAHVTHMNISTYYIQILLVKWLKISCTILETTRSHVAPKPGATPNHLA